MFMHTHYTCNNFIHNPSIQIVINQSIQPNIEPALNLSFHPSNHASICWFNPLINFSVHLSVHAYKSVAIHPSTIAIAVVLLE